jgi:hypothetical protein
LNRVLYQTFYCAHTKYFHNNSSYENYIHIDSVCYDFHLFLSYCMEIIILISNIFISLKISVLFSQVWLSWNVLTFPEASFNKHHQKHESIFSWSLVTFQSQLILKDFSHLWNKQSLVLSRILLYYLLMIIINPLSHLSLSLYWSPFETYEIL